MWLRKSSCTSRHADASVVCVPRSTLGGAESSVLLLFLLVPQVGPKITEWPQRISSVRWCPATYGRCACAPRPAPRSRVTRAFRTSQKALESRGKARSDTVNKDQKTSALPMSLKKRLFASFSVSLPLVIQVSERPQNP